MGCAGIEAGGGDGWGTIGEHDAGVVNRRAGLERNAGREPKSDLGDGARSQHLHRPGPGEPGGMRGNGVGFTDINRIHTYRSGV